MPWRENAILTGTLLAVAMGGVACERPYLTWTPREPLSARRGRWAVTVEDRRQGDPRSLGRVVGWGGAPRELVVKEDHVRGRMLELAKTAAVTAGLGLAAPAEPPTSRLELVVSKLRCDGTGFQARAELEATMRMTTAEGAEIGAPQALALRGAGGSCESAFEKTMDALLDEVAARLVNAGNRETGTGNRQQATGDRQPSELGGEADNPSGPL